MSGWKIAIWLLTTFGIAGTIALFVFAPVLGRALVAGVVRFINLLLSYRVGCALLAAIVAALITDYIRHSHEDAKHAAEVEAFEKAQEERDARIARDTREWVLKEIADATSETVKTDKDVKDFTDALPKLPEGQPAIHPGNPFRVGDDAARLRQIAGQAGRGSDGAQGVPQADTKGASLRDRIRKRLSGSGSGGAGRSEQGQ